MDYTGETHIGLTVKEVVSLARARVIMWRVHPAGHSRSGAKD